MNGYQQQLITQRLQNDSVSVQRLLGGRFVRIRVNGPILGTELIVTAAQAAALQQALVRANFTDTENPRKGD